MKSLKNQIQLISEGKGSKDSFLKESKRLLPHLIRPNAEFKETVNILASKGIIDKTQLDENVIGLPMINNPFERILTPYEVKFAQFLMEKKAEAEGNKADEKKTPKEVENIQEKGYNDLDKSDPNNMLFDQIQSGLYCEGKKSPEKTLEELKKIVESNLTKDPIYYTKNGQFGVDGVGYTTEAPGLGTPKEAKGPHKSSGYGSLNESLMSFSGLMNEIFDDGVEENEEVTESTFEDTKLEEKVEEKQAEKKGKGKTKKEKFNLMKRLKEIESVGESAAIEAKLAAIEEEIVTRENKLSTIEENEDLQEFINPAGIKTIKNEIKALSKSRDKYSKMYEKITKNSPKPINDGEVIKDDDELDVSDYEDKNLERGREMDREQRRARDGDDGEFDPEFDNEFSDYEEEESNKFNKNLDDEEAGITSY